MDLRAKIARGLRSSGYAVELAIDEDRALRLASSQKIDAAIVAPSSNLVGLAMARKLRDAVPKMLVLVERAADMARFSCSFPEADAFLLKSSSEEEVVARLAEIVVRPKAGSDASPAPTILWIGDCKLDLTARLFIDGERREVPLSPAECALLNQLANSPGQIKSRDDLRQAVAGRGADPYERSIDMIVARLRQKIEPEPKNPRLIVTIAGAGYKLVAPLPGKPSIAVLPFQNISDDPEQEYFCEGVTEDIITALSKWRWFLVISRNSSMTYRGQNVDVRQVGRELGVHYVLAGSVRKAGDRVRVSAQLIDAMTSAQLWAERFDETLIDIFKLQDEVSRNIAGAIGPTLAVNEGQRAARRPTNDPSAWDFYLRGRWHFHQQSKENRLKGLACFERAIELDPQLAEAHAWISRVVYGNIVYGFSNDRKRDLERATAEAQLALQLDNNNATAWRSLAQALSMAGENGAAVTAAKKAIELNPNMAEAHFSLAVASIYHGDPDQALVAIDTALRISPSDPQSFAWLSTRASALYLLKRYEGAIETALHGARVRQPDFRRFPTASRVLAASYAQLGREAEAEAAIREMLQNDGSERTIADVVRPFRRKEDRDHYTEGLRKAGLPEC